MRGFVVTIIALGASVSPLVGCRAAPPIVATGTTAPPPAITAAPPIEAPVPCAPEAHAAPAPSHDALTLTQVTFADLPGWPDDRHAGAVGAFLRSCARLATLRDADPVGHDGHGGKAKQWRRACAAAARLPAGDDAAARAMFEAEFVPHLAAGKHGPEGKLTGYNVQELRASRTRGGRYVYPIYDRPKDLVMIDLTRHIPDGHGRRIWGRLDARGEIVPYFTRPEIRNGALAGRQLEIMYADDPVDVLFAHIEGSGKAMMDDGSVAWLEFAGKNGRAYRGVGGVLKSMGELTAPGSGTMQGIRRWFAEHPGRFDEVVDQSHSFVFFHESRQPGAVGSQMAILTPERSIAIDRAFIAQSTPIWVVTRAPIPGKPGSVPWRQLLIAQDTGGGILGAVRGDIYWGDTAEAAERGGRMGGPGRYWLLLPRGVTR